MPGVLSARWSGRHGDEAANLRLLLAQLTDVPDERRGAHFDCAAALVLPYGEEHVAEGILRGRLIREPRGTNGFGYDPIFVPDGEDRTTAEMSAADKDAISHRGRAFRGLAEAIAAVLRLCAGAPAGGLLSSPSRLLASRSAPQIFGIGAIWLASGSSMRSGLLIDVTRTWW